MNKIGLLLNVCVVIVLFFGCKPKDSKVNVDDSKVFVEIPDLNFKAYLLENFDTNKDGNISLSEAKAITKINCSGKGIETLTGIEKFENLESLNCSNNQIEHLEIRYNRKLERLNCVNNAIPLWVYVGMSSPLRKKEIKAPGSNAPPTTNNAVNPLDEKKCLYDGNATNVQLSYVD